MLMPPVDRYMTTQPWTIGCSAPMSQALQVMREHHVRHLPVLDAGKLVGIVSERDLHFIETTPGGDPDEITIADVMVADVFTVKLDEPVDSVVETMAERKVGAAVVVDRCGDIRGIFTTVDALHYFAEVLRRVTS